MFLCCCADCHIPSRLFKRRDAAGTAADLVRTPSWHKLQGLPKHLSQIITKATGAVSGSAAAGKGCKGTGAATGSGAGTKGQAGGNKRGGRQTKARAGKTDRSRSRGRAAATAKVAEDDEDTSNSGDEHAAADSGDDMHHGDNTGEHDDISSEQKAAADRRKPRQKATGAKKAGDATAGRTKGRTSKGAAAGGKDPKVASGSGTRKSIKKRGKSTGKSLDGPSTPRGGAQQTLLAPFGAQKVPDVSSPAGSGSRPRGASARAARSHGGASPICLVQL